MATLDWGHARIARVSCIIFLGKLRQSMAFGERMLGTVALVGVGVLTVGAVLAAPALLRTARPIIRAGLRRGIEYYARARAAASEFAEDIDDLIAEVRSEIAAEQSSEAPAAPTDKVA